MSSKSFRSNPDPTFRLTGRNHCTYTRDKSFTLTLFASVFSLVTPTLRTHPCAILRRSPHPHGQQSPGLQPTQNFSQGRSSSSEPEPHGLLPDIRPIGPGEVLRRVHALISALVTTRLRCASMFDRLAASQRNSRSVGSQGIRRKRSRRNTDSAARTGAWPCER
jgi:hypothetical protein